MIDLSAATAAAEDLMVDTCRILRDPPGRRDDVLNRTTGTLEPPLGDVTTVWEGPCIVSEKRRRTSDDTEGGRQALRRVLQVRIPQSAAPTQVRDIVLILSSRRAELVDRRFRVYLVTPNTYAVTRKLMVEDEHGVTQR